MSYYEVAYSSRETVDNTRYYSEDILNRKVPGVFVECGVACGSQLGAMQDSIKSSRWIYGFDSFQGIPLASDDDDVQPGIGENPRVKYESPSDLLKSSGITVCRKEDVRKNLNRWSGNKSDNIVLVEGWFQNTVKSYQQVFAKLGGIALLRLDGDLYESTRVCLDAFLPLMTEGSILIIDDWQLTGCQKACRQYFAHFPVCQITPPYGPNDGPAYFIIRSVPALKYRKNIYSQNGEDGIFAELLRRMNIQSGWVCEFGAWDGKQCSNTFSLVEKGFQAVYIEAREDYFQDLLKTCETHSNILPIHTMVDYQGENTLDTILSKTPIPVDFEILSIDIDSYDYQVWKSVETYTPKFVIIEINSSISPLDDTHIHGVDGKEGTSFLPMLTLGKEKGYTLVCHTGNLIFARNDLVHFFTDLVIPSEHCHRSTWFF